jgi:Leucine-rich repeat (LRR) protein
LLSFNIRRSGLSGNASVLEKCHNLVQLDISHNNFTGQLPASRHWDQLTMYHASNNRFSGTLPRTLCQHAPLLRDLDISNNQVGLLLLFNVILAALGAPVLTTASCTFCDEHAACLGLWWQSPDMKVCNESFQAKSYQQSWQLTAVLAVYAVAQIAGNIPSRIGLMASLETLNLANNQFTGNAPCYMSMCHVGCLVSCVCSCRC